MDSILDPRIQTRFLTISGVFEVFVAQLNALVLLAWALNIPAIDDSVPRTGTTRMPLPASGLIPASSALSLHRRIRKPWTSEVIPCRFTRLKGKPRQFLQAVEACNGG